MIVELAYFTIKPGGEAGFEAAFPAAVRVLAKSVGYLAHELRRSIENPARYMLRIEWATLEDHTEKFRNSPAFAEWRAHIGPFFDAPPLVEHFRGVGPQP